MQARETKQSDVASKHEKLINLLVEYNNSKRSVEQIKEDAFKVITSQPDDIHRLAWSFQAICPESSLGKLFYKKTGLWQPSVDLKGCKLIDIATDLERILSKEDLYNVLNKLPDTVKDALVKSAKDKLFVNYKYITMTVMMIEQLRQKKPSPLTPELKQKLLDLGCNSGVLDAVIKSDFIKNYETLYQSLSSNVDASKLSAWEIYCLSGDLFAIHDAIKNNIITKNTENKVGTNPLHFAAFIGSPAAMALVILLLDIDPNIKSKADRNALLYAFMSDSKEAVDYAISSLKNNISSRDENGANGLHLAAAYASEEMMRFAISKGIDPMSTDVRNANALHHAAYRGSAERMRCAVSFGINVHSVENGGLTVLHNAAMSNSIEAVIYARKLGVDLNAKTTKTGAKAEDCGEENHENRAKIKEILSMSDKEFNEFLAKQEQQEPKEEKIMAVEPICVGPYDQELATKIQFALLNYNRSSKDSFFVAPAVSKEKAEELLDYTSPPPYLNNRG